MNLLDYYSIMRTLIIILIDDDVLIIVYLKYVQMIQNI